MFVVMCDMQWSTPEGKVRQHIHGTTLSCVISGIQSHVDFLRRVADIDTPQNGCPRNSLASSHASQRVQRLAWICLLTRGWFLLWNMENGMRTCMHACMQRVRELEFSWKIQNFLHACMRMRACNSHAHMNSNSFILKNSNAHACMQRARAREFEFSWKIQNFPPNFKSNFSDAILMISCRDFSCIHIRKNARKIHLWKVTVPQSPFTKFVYLAIGVAVPQCPLKLSITELLSRSAP